MKFPEICSFCQSKDTCWVPEKPLPKVSDCLLLATTPPPFSEDSTCPRCKENESLGVSYVRVTGLGFSAFVTEYARTFCNKCHAHLDRIATEEESIVETFSSELSII